MYTLLSNNIIKQSIDFSQGICITQNDYWDSIRIIAVATLIISGVSIFLNFKLFYQLFSYIDIIDEKRKKSGKFIKSYKYENIYNSNIKYEKQLTIRRNTLWKLEENEDSQSNISVDFEAEKKEKNDLKLLRGQALSKFFSFWYLFHVIGNFVQCASSALILSTYPNLYMESLLLGLGTFMCWITSLRFIAKTPQYYVLFKTIELSAPTIGKVLFGTLPVYIGYALTGACLFWRSERFQDTQASLISLLPMFWGNNIYDNYNSITGYLSIFSQLYIYGYAIFFSCIVFNVFIATVTNQYGKVLDFVETQKKQKIEEKEKLRKESKEKKFPYSLSEEKRQEAPMNISSKLIVDTMQGMADKLLGSIECLGNEERDAALASNSEAISKLMSTLQKCKA